MIFSIIEYDVYYKAEDVKWASVIDYWDLSYEKVGKERAFFDQRNKSMIKK